MHEFTWIFLDFISFDMYYSFCFEIRFLRYEEKFQPPIHSSNVHEALILLSEIYSGSFKEHTKIDNELQFLQFYATVQSFLIVIKFLNEYRFLYFVRQNMVGLP